MIMASVHVDIMISAAAGEAPLEIKNARRMDTHAIPVPVMTNSKDIHKDEELVLFWRVIKAEVKGTKRGKSWIECLPKECLPKAPRKDK